MGFRIEAKTINERARELVLADKWAEAQRFLRGCLPSMSTDHAYRVMSGETRLVNLDGTGRVTASASGDLAFADARGLGPDAADIEYERQCRSKWAAILATSEGHYVPYAYVSNFGAGDLPIDGRASLAAERYIAANGLVPFFRAHRDYLGRPVHYMDDVEKDRAWDLRLPDGYCPTNIGPDFPVLFRVVPTPPPWIQATRSPERALEEFLSFGRSLQERGHCQKYEGGRRALGFPSVPSQGPAPSRDPDADPDATMREVEAMRRSVMRQAAVPGRDGWLKMRFGKRTLDVPRAPFEHWALDRCGAGHLAPPWDVCSRPGLKAGMESGADDPMHTDWMLGAGLDVLGTRWYGASAEATSLMRGAYALMAEIQRERMSFDCSVLSGTGRTSGHAFVARRGRSDLPRSGDVVVLPDARPDWLPLVAAACVDGAGAVVLSRGGAMAHLVNVGRERGIPIVRVEGAAEKYVDGQLLSVDCESGRVTIMPLDLDDAVELPSPSRPGGLS